MSDKQAKRSPRNWWYLLFLIVLGSVIWPPFYNRIEPTLIGIPFFYWYKLLCVIICTLITGFIYFVVRRIDPSKPQAAYGVHSLARRQTK